ncbi:MAG: tRNA (adenosine(37)-N6)-threonylcarbamoyltransferase complex dimerization subunit type 1 TsaB [Candidatus Hydrogenedentes bacterium]|nr:tRNA (adenosine(37)-N6)-threonylcarbamoyltransferase complex dimerization subunit type 1 TsaB [Candidatus Hydrogenedentota bacterium]
MIILAADTSTSFLSVAICESADKGNGVRVIVESTDEADRRHCERLLDTMDRLLDEAGMTLSEVELLAISKGPGSFTGLRVGLATWKGLALGSGIPLVGVSTLDAMTHSISMDNGTLCVLLDARMDEVFAAVYHYRDGTRTPLLAECVGPVETMFEHCEEQTVFMGDGATRYRDQITSWRADVSIAEDSIHAPQASGVAAEAWARAAKGFTDEATSIAPVYLRRSQAEEARDAATPSPDTS